MAGSKKFKDKVCVYCRENNSATADHVFPREFFQIEQRDKLPKVPACTTCNNEKSRLEHYLTTVLPFGATHRNALKALKFDTPQRLKNNRALQKKIRESTGQIFIPAGKNRLEQRIATDFDYEILHQWAGFVGRGLMWHHWNRYLPIDAAFTVFTPSEAGAKLISRLFSHTSTLTINQCLADNTVRYRGMMSEQDKEVSVWAIQVMGGITLADENAEAVFSNSYVAMITGKSDTIKNFEANLRT